MANATVLGVDVVKLVRHLKQLESRHYHGILEIKIYDGQIKQIKENTSLDMRRFWPEIGVDRETEPVSD